MCWQRDNPSDTMNNQGNMVTQKEHDNSPETQLKVMEDCGLNVRECKTSVMNKFDKL